MHGWEGKAFDDIATLTVKRDPRRFPLGCATTDDARECIQWFRNVPELTQYLLRMEPQRWGVRHAELIALKARLEPALTQVDVFGLSEAARQAHNACSEPAYRIVWWGTFDTLLAGGDEWSRALLTAAQAHETAYPQRAERVIDYLRERARVG